MTSNPDFYVDFTQYDMAKSVSIIRSQNPQLTYDASTVSFILQQRNYFVVQLLAGDPDAVSADNPYTFAIYPLSNNELEKLAARLTRMGVSINVELLRGLFTSELVYLNMAKINGITYTPQDIFDQDQKSSEQVNNPSAMPNPYSESLSYSYATNPCPWRTWENGVNSSTANTAVVQQGLPDANRISKRKKIKRATFIKGAAFFIVGLVVWWVVYDPFAWRESKTITAAINEYCPGASNIELAKRYKRADNRTFVELATWDMPHMSNLSWNRNEQDRFVSNDEAKSKIKNRCDVYFSVLKEIGTN